MNACVKAVCVAGALCVLVSSVAPVVAQRGGRGRDESAPLTSFDNKEFGIAFAVPQGLALYTSESPGRYAASLVERKFALLVNPIRIEDTISIKYADGMTEADLKAYHAVLSSNPPQSKLPGFEKVSLELTAIGKDGSEEAVDFVYRVKQGNNDMTLRQIVFVHKGRGFTVLCGSKKRDFEKANLAWFTPLVKQIEFK
jgi:hypothetical protein